MARLLLAAALVGHVVCAVICAAGSASGQTPPRESPLEAPPLLPALRFPAPQPAGPLAEPAPLSEPAALSLPGVLAQPAPPSDPAPLATTPSAEMLQPTPEMQRFITEVARAVVPREHVDKREWGQTVEVWDGVDIRREGWQIKTKRKKKQANHGAWRMYEARLVDPEETFFLRVDNLRPAGPGRARFDLTATARLKLTGRASRWVYDAQLWSFSAEADAHVELRTECEVAFHLGGPLWAPTVRLAPWVDAAELRLRDFELHSVSKLGGDAAEELGRGLRRFIEWRLEEDRDKITHKINRAIEKNQDKLQLDLAVVLASPWKSLVGETGKP